MENRLGRLLAVTDPSSSDGGGIDFNDVFGGPPKRFSFGGVGGRVETEKPVFGESARRHADSRSRSEDFYDDIFRKSDDSYGSPRWSCTPPGSSPLHPKFETPSLPAQFSLPTFGSSSSSRSPYRYKEGTSTAYTPTTSLSRFSSQAMQEHHDFTNTHENSPAQTSLSHESSLDSKQHTASPSREFHFSIHKWAGRGVPLLISLRGGKNPTLKDSSKVSPMSNLQDVDFLSQDSLASKSEPAIAEQEVNEQEVKRGDKEISRKAEGKETLNSNVDTTGKTEGAGKKMSSMKKTEVNKPAVLSPKKVKGKVRDFVNIFNQEGSPKTKTADSSSTKGIDGKLGVDGVEMASNASSTTQLGSKVAMDSVNMMSDASRTAGLGGNMHSKDVKMTELESKKAADNENTKVDAPSTTKLDSKLPPDEVKAGPNTAFMADGYVEKQQTGRNRTIRKLSDIRFPQTDAPPSSGAVPYGTKVTSENIEEPSLDNFHVQELCPDEENLSTIDDDSEAIKASDSKIRVWSNGRKGNIRSLLSTLQLVLWAESGWKPVALVDIIEANAVKKAYNRAMLCLHPDKLQQKGAAPHQKYLAEKVFDILQEAWDHFNSLGTLT